MFILHSFKTYLKVKFLPHRNSVRFHYKDESLNAVCCEHQRQHINPPCGKIAEYLMFKYVLYRLTTVLERVDFLFYSLIPHNILLK
jgi:hypothetical protein